MPQSGAFRLDGSNEENIGEQPDVQVPLSPDDWLSDRDPQLDKAIELLTGSAESKAPDHLEP
jgi:tricorn protease